METWQKLWSQSDGLFIDSLSRETEIGHIWAVTKFRNESLPLSLKSNCMYFVVVGLGLGGGARPGD